MDIQRPSTVRAKQIRRVILGTVGLVMVAGVSLGVSRLRPAAPSVARDLLLIDQVKRGQMLREVRGLGTMVPEEIFLP